MRCEAGLLIKVYVIMSVGLVLAAFGETRKEGQSQSISVDTLFGTVCYTEMYKASQPVGSATAFFYYHDPRLFLITNYHVVYDEKNKIYPDELWVTLHTDATALEKTDVYRIALYDDKGKPRWLEHPRYKGKLYDVVAIPLDKKEMKRFAFYAFTTVNQPDENTTIGVGEEILILGFPLGFKDPVTGLPILRGAIFSSAYPGYFANHPYILLDTKMHAGDSGSPVVSKPTKFRSTRETYLSVYSIPQVYLLGVHAGYHPFKKDEATGESLNFGVVYNAALLPELIAQ